MSFCTECGAKLEADAVFCSECGTKVEIDPEVAEKTEPKVKVEVEIEESIEKVKPFKTGTLGTLRSEKPEEPKEPKEIFDTSVKSLSKEFSSLEMERVKYKPQRSVLGSLFSTRVNPYYQRELALIQNFPLPDSAEEVLKFVQLANSRIDKKLSKNTLLNRLGRTDRLEDDEQAPTVISDAWVKKLESVYEYAESMFSDDPLFSKIKQTYEREMKALNKLK